MVVKKKRNRSALSLKQPREYIAVPYRFVTTRRESGIVWLTSLISLKLGLRSTRHALSISGPLK